MYSRPRLRPASVAMAARGWHGRLSPSARIRTHAWTNAARSRGRFEMGARAMPLVPRWRRSRDRIVERAVARERLVEPTARTSETPSPAADPALRLVHAVLHDRLERSHTTTIVTAGSQGRIVVAPRGAVTSRATPAPQVSPDRAVAAPPASPRALPLVLAASRRPTATEREPVTPIRPMPSGSPLSWPPASPSDVPPVSSNQHRLALAPHEVERLTDQVIDRIERRAIAARERLGRR